MKKQILLTALTLTLLASAVMTAATEEAVATILFEPTLLIDGLSLAYPIDSTGNGVVDRRFRAYRNTRTDTVFETLTNYYLKPGTKFIFEDKGLDPFEEVVIADLIAIEINGRMVELTEMFPRNIIDERLSKLREKLRAQGR